MFRDFLGILLLVFSTLSKKICTSHRGVSGGALRCLRLYHSWPLMRSNLYLTLFQDIHVLCSWLLLQKRKKCGSLGWVYVFGWLKSVLEVFLYWISMLSYLESLISNIVTGQDKKRDFAHGGQKCLYVLRLVP